MHGVLSWCKQCGKRRYSRNGATLTASERHGYWRAYRCPVKGSSGWHLTTRDRWEAPA